jgi:isopropylmalate/homocitrate/citramalate synthase
LDTTLREGEQTPYVNFLVEKLEIVRRLERISEEMIEAGNPSVSSNMAAEILSAVMILDHIDESSQAARSRAAVWDTLSAGIVTEDMGGNVSTQIMA